MRFMVSENDKGKYINRSNVAKGKHWEDNNWMHHTQHSERNCSGRM